MSFPRAKRFSESRVDETPGPAQYNIKLNSVNKDTVKYKICSSPRFPETCGRKLNERECTKCSNADHLSSISPKHSCSRSFNSSLNSSTENIDSYRRFTLPPKSHYSRLHGICQNMSEVRKDLKHLMEKQQSDNSKLDNSCNGIELEGLTRTPCGIVVNDSTVTEDEKQEKVNSNPTRRNTQSRESARSVGNTEIESSQHSSEDLSLDENSIASSSERLTPGDNLPTYTEIYAPNEDVCKNSPDCCESTSDGKLCDLCKRKIAASKILELQNMMAIHRMEMKRMHDLVDDVSRVFGEIYINN